MVEKSEDADVDRIQQAVTTILESAVTDLSKAVPKEQLAREGEKRLLFPDGINFIAVTLAFDPAKVNFSASLTISSQPVKASFLEPKEAIAEEFAVLRAAQVGEGER
jgi:hypothetical protein